MPEQKMKKSDKANTTGGFTLVELSIVLVIIGLLIGGILAAQSMIVTSKVQAQIRQIGQFDAAFANFHTKYNQLPGDNTLFGSAPGNNDGTIGDDTGGVLNFAGEIGKFWYDLGQNGLGSQNGISYIDDNGGGTAVGATAAPRAIIGATGNFVIAYGISSKNYYSIGQTTSDTASSNVITQGVGISPSDALAIDVKLDDGIANGTGKVVGSDSGVLTPSLNSSYDATTCGASATTYNTAYSGNLCALTIRIGSATGVLN